MTRAIMSLLLLALPASAQVEMQRPYSATAPHFHFEALNFKTPSSESRFDFYFQIPYSELHFIRSGNEFTAAYEINTRFVGKDGRVAVDESWGEKVNCRGFDETENRNILSSSERHFVVKPGPYALYVTVTEPETGDSYTVQRDILARDFTSQATSISNIMLLFTATASGEKRTIVPNVGGNVFSESDSFPVFYEVYPSDKLDSFNVTTEIIGTENRILYSNSTWFDSRYPVTQIFGEIPKTSLSMSGYVLRVSVRGSNEKGEPITATAETAFSLFFPGLPPTITDLDEAADELLFIASSSTIDSIKASPDIGTKAKRFLSFWHSYHSNLSSDAMFAMREYYNRVSYANEHFTHFFAGWKSDRGMIYILFGPPDNVDRHPFNIDSKPYEIWQYYRKARRFLFVDDTGFGDYRLRSPAWDSNSPYSGMDFTRN